MQQINVKLQTVECNDRLRLELVQTAGYNFTDNCL